MATVVEFLLAGFTDNSGEPLALGKVYTYQAGTLTPKATYVDSLAQTSEQNPVILDANGRKQIYATGSYKFIIKTAADATLYTLDNLFFGDDSKVTFLGTTTGSPNAYVATPTPAESSYADGSIYIFQASFANTGAATLNISGVGAYPVASYVGQIVSGFTYTVRWNASASAFNIINPSPGFATTQAEISALNSAGAEIVINQSITLSGALTLTAPLRINQGGKIITGSNILTINGSFGAGLYQCFDTTATKVVFGGDAVKEAYPQWFGALADGSNDDTVAVQAALTSHGRVFFPVGDYRITATLTCTHAVFMEGASPPSSSGPNSYQSVLRHDFNGTFISFTGSEASRSGGGGGIRNMQLYNVYGSAGTAYGIAIQLLFTSTALRSTWVRIENVNIEQESSAGTWTYCLDMDGSAAATTDSLRDFWVSGCRFLCDTGGTAAVRLRKVIALHFLHNILNGAKGDMSITGDATTLSGQNWIHGGGGQTLNLDYADNTHVSASLWTDIVDTANSTNTTVRMSKSTNHIRLLGTGFVDYYKATDFTHIHQSNGSYVIFSRDEGAGDTTSGVGVALGNHGANEGFALSEYLNTAASGAPFFRTRFLPRNNADSGPLVAAQYAGIYLTKTAGADTCKTELMSTGGTLTLNADGSTSLSSTKLEFSGVASLLGIFVGSGTPESVVTAVVGSIFLRTNGGAGTTLYVKQSGVGNTGWIGK